jgi:hypothetical protein
MRPQGGSVWDKVREAESAPARVRRYPTVKGFTGKVAKPVCVRHRVARRYRPRGRSSGSVTPHSSTGNVRSGRPPLGLDGGDGGRKRYITHQHPPA